MEEKDINSIVAAVTSSLAKLDADTAAKEKEKNKDKDKDTDTDTDKDTPYGVFKCPECAGEITGGIMYCQHCGCELEWEE